MVAMILGRSRQIIALRKLLLKARGYHATKIGDAIACHEDAMIRYANIIMEHNHERL